MDAPNGDITFLSNEKKYDFFKDHASETNSEYRFLMYEDRDVSSTTSGPGIFHGMRYCYQKKSPVEGPQVYVPINKFDEQFCVCVSAARVVDPKDRVIDLSGGSLSEGVYRVKEIVKNPFLNGERFQEDVQGLIGAYESFRVYAVWVSGWDRKHFNRLMKVYPLADPIELRFKIGAEYNKFLSEPWVKPALLEETAKRQGVESFGEETSLYATERPYKPHQQIKRASGCKEALFWGSDERWPTDYDPFLRVLGDVFLTDKRVNVIPRSVKEALTNTNLRDYSFLDVDSIPTVAQLEIMNELFTPGQTGGYSNLKKLFNVATAL